MAEIADNNFKEEMMRMMKAAILKIGDNSREVSLLRRDLDKNTREFKNLKKEFRVGSAGLSDLRFRVLEMLNRVFEVETRLKSFNEELPDLEVELRELTLELADLMSDIEDDAETRLKIDGLYSQVEKLEEEVFYI